MAANCIEVKPNAIMYDINVSQIEQEKHVNHYVQENIIGASLSKPHTSPTLFIYYILYILSTIRRSVNAS